MAQIPPDSLEGMPDLQKEAEAARKTNQEEQQKEFRRRMPQQMKMVYQASPEQLRELFAYFDPVIQKQIAGALPPSCLKIATLP
ncbi:MAG: hypothetical protein M3N54_06595 [Acidobacteriota bacterium]|nr:hypothetical protein [Acidobacteriota bacterium]